MAKLEHVNITIPNLDETVAWMKDVFGWHIRWEGEAMNGAGRTLHIGTDESYVALYQPYTSHPLNTGCLNHIAVVVDDIDAAERAVKAYFEPTSHADYEPGKRFYFMDSAGLEFEVVSYS